MLGCSNSAEIDSTANPTPSESKPSSNPSSLASAPTAKIEDVSATIAAKLIEQSGAIVLDIRTPAEFAKGHIEGAQNLDYRTAGFADKLAELDRKATYLVH